MPQGLNFSSKRWHSTDKHKVGEARGIEGGFNCSHARRFSYWSFTENKIIKCKPVGLDYFSTFGWKIGYTFFAGDTLPLTLKYSKNEIYILP